MSGLPAGSWIMFTAKDAQAKIFSTYSRGYTSNTDSNTMITNGETEVALNCGKD